MELTPPGSEGVPTIHIATVHWRTDRWIDIQLRYLHRHLGGSFRTYAFLNGLPRDHSAKFFYTSQEPIRDHATKLNLLCDVICSAAEDPSELLIVIDGDSFPIAPIAPLLAERLQSHRLVAVQRRENMGDLQPHPSFCATTVGFWTALGGDWRPGYKWRNSRGRSQTDVGANLLAQLEREGVDWYPLRRVNRANLDPVNFGLYGDRRHGPLVYHHGAGFRKGVGREVKWRAGLHDLTEESERDELWRRLKSEKKRMDREVFERIERHEDFWREFA